MRQWRLRHVTTVERIIGLKMGTGGTAGVPVPPRAAAARAVPGAVAGEDRAVSEPWTDRTGSAPSCSGRRARSWPSALDATPDPASQRDLFLVPEGVAYLAGNSLGLQPRAVRAAIDEVLDSWATLGVAGHVEGDHPWAPYHENMRETVARLVGARPGEAVVMNSLRSQQTDR